MRTNVIVVDNFFENPDAVREFALAQQFDVKGNYPGFRTKSFATEDFKKTFESIIGRKVTWWPTEPSSYNASFQYTTKTGQDSWVHRDQTRWAGVIYLTPNAPLNGGTAFFRHKVSGLSEIPPGTPKEIETMMDNDSNDMSKWDMIDCVGNVYNRLVLFQGSRSHRSMEYFGDCKENGRLFMCFFMNTE